MHQDNYRAKHFTRIGGPYYQVAITAHQQRQLLSLESRVANRAVVRYVAPAFWSRADFDSHDENAAVLSHSSFVSPVRVKTHSKWMYARQGGTAIFNPEPEQADGESWETLITVLSDSANSELLSDHVRALAKSLATEAMSLDAEGDYQSISRLHKHGRFAEHDIEWLVSLARI